jgi:glycosyltransferase involved in cell wall biosynthesis
VSVRALHQLVPSFVHRDAIGNHAIQVQSVIRGMGLDSDIVVDDAGPEYRSASIPYDRYRGGGDVWLMYQASTGSRLASWFRHRPETKLVNYHNVTPPECFEKWEPRLADEVAEGRRQVSQLADVTRHAIAVSRYNQLELDAFGYRRTSTVPLLMDLSSFDRQTDPSTNRWLERLKEGGGPDVLFCGRIVPNKAQHDLVKALIAYRRLYDPRARLHLTGGVSSGAYHFALKRFIGANELWDAVDLAGSVSNEELSSYFRGADVYVCLSDHEGFGAPLLEAMHAGVPIIAYAAAAVPETVGDAALLLPSKEPALVAGAIHRVVTDPTLRQRLVQAGRRRLADFDLTRTRGLLEKQLSALLAEA